MLVKFTFTIQFIIDIKTRYFSDVHSYNLKNSSINLYIPKPKLEIEKHSFHYRGSVLWNKIRVEAREQESLVLFKSSLKDTLSEIK